MNEKYKKRAEGESFRVFDKLCDVIGRLLIRILELLEYKITRYLDGRYTTA